MASFTIIGRTNVVLGSVDAETDDAALAAFDKANKASVGEAKVKGLRAVLGGRQEERAFCCVWIEE
jgi:hypothetical protein